jgi:dUTP pyrophosphatase
MKQTINDFENENAPNQFTTRSTRFIRKRYSKRNYRKPFIVEAVLTEDATSLQLPEYKTIGAAGADLKALFDGKCEPGKIAKLVRTGIKIKIPKGYEAQIRPRSGLGMKGLMITNTPGTIDSDYRGELMINFYNCGEETIEWKAGERIAQLVIAPVKRAIFEMRNEFSPDKFNNDRGEGGFGSTNTK